MGCTFTDVSPNYSMSLNSLANSIGAIAGILGPIVVSALTESYPGVNGWRAAFILTFCMSTAMLILWALVIRAEVIPELNQPVSNRASASSCNVVHHPAVLEESSGDSCYKFEQQ